MTPSLLKLLRSVDTPTVCNAVEVAEGRRGFANFTRSTMVCTAPDDAPVVGYARTARIVGAAPPSEPADTVKDRRMAYYRYVAEAEMPAVAVVEDLDFPACVGAFWGEINTSVHKGFGLSGVVTNGVVRDLGDLPEGFPVVAGSVGPSHGFVHVREFDTAVSVCGMTVKPGDLVHADRHGALVVPREAVARLPAAIEQLLSTERIVLDAARRPDFDYARFEEAWRTFEQART